jgi:tetratricopeptide (TPR) repeat protein
MTLSPARIAAIVLGVSLLAFPAESQDRKQEKKMNAQELKRMVGEGDRLLAAGNPIEARKHYLAVIEQEPGNASVALKLAQASEQIQDWDGAIGAYKIVASSGQGTEKADGHAGLAAAYVRTGQFREAADNARQAIQLNPAAASARASLAYSLVRLGSTDEALAEARKAIELAPTSALAHVTLGEALLGAGNVAEAEGALRKALEMDPKAADALAALAEIQHRKGDHAGAVSSASKALEINSNLARAYLARGKANHARGQALMALPDLTTGLKGDPNDVEAHLALAQIHRSSNPTLAVASYQKVLALDPARGIAYLELAEISVRQGDHASARQQLEKATERLPQSARAHHLLGGVLEKQRDPERALQEYSRAAELDPKLAEAHHAKGRLLREQKKDTAGALTSFEKAAELSPSNAQFLTDLGVALYDAKQGERAGEVLSKAVAMSDYNNPIGFGVLGLVLKDKQNFADALGWFDKAAALSTKWWLPHWGAAWSHFGLIKKGCPCGSEDDERVRKIKEHYDQMVAVGGKDPALEQRVDALQKGQKIK